jgi:hypothetical protein
MFGGMTAPDYNRRLAVRTPYAAWLNQSSD